jgi:hypothetical protein
LESVSFVPRFLSLEQQLLLLLLESKLLLSLLPQSLLALQLCRIVRLAHSCGLVATKRETFLPAPPLTTGTIFISC